MKVKKGKDIFITPSLRIHSILTPLTILGQKSDNVEVRRDKMMETVKIRAMYDVVCTLLLEKTQALSSCNINDKQHFKKLSNEYKDAVNQLQFLVDTSIGSEIAQMIKEQDPESESDNPSKN
jgi:hypothetical protein